MILNFNKFNPQIAGDVFVAPNASVIGNVHIGEKSSVWFGAVVRADSNSIKIGNRSNIQDLSCLHVDGNNQLVIGDDVTVGHRAILHGCRIENRVLVGMGAIIMNGAVIGEDSIVGAGALVTEGTQIPPHSLVLGMPAKLKRPLTDDEVAMILKAAGHYSKNSAQHSANVIS